MLHTMLSSIVVLASASLVASAAPLQPETAALLARQIKQPAPIRADVSALVFERMGNPPSRQEIEASLRSSLGRGRGTSEADLAMLERSVQRNADMQMKLIEAGIPTRYRVRLDQGLARMDFVNKPDSSIPAAEDTWTESRITRFAENGQITQEISVNHELRSTVTRSPKRPFTPPSWLDFNGLPSIARSALLQHVATARKIALTEVAALPDDAVAAALLESSETGSAWRVAETPKEGSVVTVSLAAANLKEPLLEIDLDGAALEHTLRVVLRDPIGGRVLFTRQVTQRDDRGNTLRFTQQEFSTNGSLLRSFDVAVESARDSRLDPAFVHADALDSIPQLYAPSPLSR